jgi:hypothetical protein
MGPTFSFSVSLFSCSFFLGVVRAGPRVWKYAHGNFDKWAGFARLVLRMEERIGFCL